MRPALAFLDPQAALADVERQMDAIPDEALFNRSKHQKLLEHWCAAMFGVGYSKRLHPYQIALNKQRYREDADFFVRALGHGARAAPRTGVQTVPPGHSRDSDTAQFRRGSRVA